MSLLAQIYRSRHSSHLYIPDTEGAPAGGASPAPAPAPAPAAPAKQSTPAPPAAPPKPSPTLKASETPKIKGVLSVAKALKLTTSPKKLNDDEAAALGQRSKADTIIDLPPEKKDNEDDITPPIRKPKPEGSEPAPTPEPKPEPTPAPEVKVKIAGKEMTQKEAEEYVADLQKKAEAAQVKPPEPKIEKTPAQIAAEKAQEAAENQRLDNEWIDKHADVIGIDQASFDKILADGDVAGFNRILAKAVLSARKSITDQVNPILEDLYNRANPGYETHQEIARLTAEQTFLADAKNADLAPYRSRLKWADDLMREKYPEDYAKSSPSDRLAAAAANVRNLIAGGFLAPDAAAPNAKPAGAPAPTAAPAPKPPQPKPPTGNLGGAPAPTKTTKAGGLISALESYKRKG